MTGRDRGSATPLVLGMALILLLLVGGVTAFGSAFLARQELQRLCDAAAVAAGDAAAASPAAPGPAAVQAAAEQARRNSPERPVTTQVRLDDLAAHVRCTGAADLTFGGLFDLRDVTFEVDAVGRPSVLG